MHFKQYLTPINGCIRDVSLISKERDYLRDEVSDTLRVFKDDASNIETINRLLAYYEVHPFNDEKTAAFFNGNNHDQRLWAFDYLGLKGYSLYDEERLIIRDSKELKCIKEPEDLALVLFVSDKNTRYVKQRGIVVNNVNNVRIISRIGQDNPGVYIHNLELTPSKYGDYVMFFRKVV